MIALEEALCTGCGACAGVCPHEAIMFLSGRIHISGERCDGCGVCVPVCPTGALTLAEIIPAPEQPARIITSPRSSALVTVGAGILILAARVLPVLLPEMLRWASRENNRSRRETGSLASSACICPGCGRTFDHIRRIPCRMRTCPDCGARLIRR